MNNQRNYKKFYMAGIKEGDYTDEFYKEKKIIKIFKMTAPYKKELKMKRLEALELEIKTIKNRIEFERKNYGQVDEIEINEYLYLNKLYYKMLND